jgi:hypothetical protein
MAVLNRKRNVWIIPVAAGILAIAALLIQQKWLPDYQFEVFLLDIVILAIAFSWVYFIDKREYWWAQIPALAMVVLLATGIVAYNTPKDASGSSPYGVITLGLGAAIMGWLINHRQTRLVMYIIALITLLVGILMLPISLTWQIILIVAEVLIIGFLIWRAVANMPRR